MSLAVHLFHSPLCMCHLNYFMGWFFLIVGYIFVISIILANPLKINYGDNKEIIEILFIIAGCFFVTIVSRCLCYNKEKYRDNKESILNKTNEIYYS